MSVERHLHQCDVTITASGWTFKGVEQTEDMYTSVDKVMDKVEKQIRRAKGRERDRKGPGASSTLEALEQLGTGRLGVAGPPVEDGADVAEPGTPGADGEIEGQDRT